MGLGEEDGGFDELGVSLGEVGGLLVEEFEWVDQEDELVDEEE